MPPVWYNSAEKQTSAKRKYAKIEKVAIIRLHKNMHPDTNTLLHHIDSVPHAINCIPCSDVALSCALGDSM